MNWNQEELEQWAVTQQQKEEDNEAVEKYRLQDDTKIKELNIAVERMNRDVFGKKAGLEREVTETQVRVYTGCWQEHNHFIVALAGCMATRAA